MKVKSNNYRTKLRSRKGMTLVEVLVAMTLLTLIILVFTPMFMSYYRNLRTAGELTQKTYERASLMERLIANPNNNDDGYETSVSSVPIKLTVDGTTTTVDFDPSSTDFDSLYVDGTMVSESLNGENSYVSFYTASTSDMMVAMPTTLTDDFLTKDILVIPKGDYFVGIKKLATNQTTDAHWVVKYAKGVTNFKDSASWPTLSTNFYSVSYVADGNDYVAKFTFKGGNDEVCFENSPLEIQYYSSVSGNPKRVRVEINAPEIIMVGERASDNNYYYYATAGVDTSTGRMDIIAKNMPNAPLVSAMNDVEWVPAGYGDNGGTNTGDDGSKNINEYGYYIMGGDAGQVRRFWKRKDLPTTAGGVVNSENYTWAGDYLTNYYCDYDLYDSGNKMEKFGGLSNPKDNGTTTPQTKELTTQAMFKSIYRDSAQKTSFIKTRAGSFTNNSIWGITATLNTLNYGAAKFNSFTANVDSSDYGRYYIQLAGARSVKSWGKWYKYYGFANGMSKDEAKGIMEWFTGGSGIAQYMNVEGYKKAVNYEYSTAINSNAKIDDTSLITITSVGAVQMNTGKYTDSGGYKEKQDNSDITNNVYPKASYTLYCGYIPYVTDYHGWWNGSGHNMYTLNATIGIAYADKLGSWVPTGKMGDLYTTSTTLSSSLFTNMDYGYLLNYYDLGDNGGNSPVTDPNTGMLTKDWLAIHSPTSKRDTTYPAVSSGVYYKPGSTTSRVGQALSGEGHDYYYTAAHEVDITMGYLSNPYAIGVENPTEPKTTSSLKGNAYFQVYNGLSGSFQHTYFSTGLRDNVTMLDIKSFRDDLSGNNISLAVGYSLSFLLNDYSYSTRLGQVYNTGIVYIRSCGNDSSNSDTFSVMMNSGKGWSLGYETNVFHEFYGIDQYQNENSPTVAAKGWDTTLHRNYFNLPTQSNKAPQPGQTPSMVMGNTSFGTNCHALADTECTTVNWGHTWDFKPQAMWGTANGTLLSWCYDYENPTNSKITAVTKEFESYQWAQRIGITDLLNASDTYKKAFFDYTSTSHSNYDDIGFVSVLSSINDVCYSDDIWVAVGNQSRVAPDKYCVSRSLRTSSALDGNSHSTAASYVNVKFTDEDLGYARWIAIKISEENNINIISVVNCQGVWYLMGYVDANNNGKNDNEKCVLYYSTKPEERWVRCITKRNEANDYSSKTTYDSYAVYYNASGTLTEVELTGINKMACQS